jgi:MoaA/NifB/PqqE/SkfB family radical SAM enzyme
MNKTVKGRIHNLREWLSLFAHTSYIPVHSRKRQYPENLQFPITKKCNSQCVTCNIWKEDAKGEISPEELRRHLNDPIFKKIRSVGINGGEPLLHKELITVVNVITERLKKLKAINLITNGLSSRKTLEIFELLVRKCRENGIRFNVAVSLDGVGIIHDQARGIPNAFIKTMATIKEINGSKKKILRSFYCFMYDIEKKR